MRPLTIPERRAIDRKFPRAACRDVGNAMFAGACILVAIGAACLLIFGGPAR